jgi:hypothetical protein
VIAAKAVAFKLAAEPEFAERQRRTLRGAQIIAERLLDPEVAAAGVSVVTGGTDVHLVLVDLRDSDLDGQQGEDRLHRVGITMNRNAVPFDPRPPMVSSGLRIGTPPLATRISDKVRYPVLGATFQPRGGIAKHDHVAWAFARKADEMGVDLIQNCEVNGFIKAETGWSGSRPVEERSPLRRWACPRPDTPVCWPSSPASTCPSSPTRCKRSSPSCTSLCIPRW